MFTEQQIYLLKSALLPANKAIHYWEKWKGMNQYPTADPAKLRLNIFDNLDPETQKLLALIYRNLNEYSGTDPYLRAIKSIVRYNWFRKEHLWSSFGKLAKKLNDRGIVPVLFKGGATSLCYYPDRNARFLADIDLFFDEHADTIVRETILAQGGRDVYYFSGKYSSLIFHAAQYSSEQKEDFDVHRHFLHEHLYAEANSKLLTGKTSQTLADGSRFYVLSATVQLFLSLVHGTRSEDANRVLWAADAWYILKNEGGHVNWDELIGLSNYFRYDMLILETLSELRGVLGLEIPANVIMQLQLAKTGPKLRNYLVNRGRKKNERLPELWRSLLDCIAVYRLFLKKRVNYSFASWLFYNYAYRSERLIKRL